MNNLLLSAQTWRRVTVSIVCRINLPSDVGTQSSRFNAAESKNNPGHSDSNRLMDMENWILDIRKPKAWFLY